MEGFLLGALLPAIVDEPGSQQAFHHVVDFNFAVRRAILIDPGRVSFARTLNQIQRPLSGACFHVSLLGKPDSRR